jgi:hypothetical protein
MHKFLATLIVLGFAITGCAGDSDGGRAGQLGRQDTQTAADEHAPASVVPGSYEDWCGEHGVPESACTRCDPSLIPAFKATNDWCAEHNLPESQCKACNPDLVIVRPPKPEGN